LRDPGEAKKFRKTIISAVQSPATGDSGGFSGESVGLSGVYRGRDGAGGIKDIYTGLPVKESGMSIDHFIPWSFVLHSMRSVSLPKYRSVEAGWAAPPLAEV